MYVAHLVGHILWWWGENRASIVELIGQVVLVGITITTTLLPYHLSQVIGALLKIWHPKHLPVPDLYLTHEGRVTHICVGKLTIIGSDNGLAPGRRQAII